MNDRISALMDGELDDRPARDTIEALTRDAQALAAWRTYHLISDAMRDTRLLSTGFAERLSQRLAAEPTVLAPAALPARSRETGRWVALSAAASVSAVALVGWLAFAPQQPGAPAVAPVAQAPAVPVSLAEAPAGQAAARQKPQSIPLPAATNDYLLAHQGFAPRGALGMAPYVRTVAETREQRR